MTAQPLLTPELHLDGSGPRALLRPISAELAELHDARPGELVAVALGHCTPRPDLRRPISEYMCAFLSTGAGCKPAAFAMPLAAMRTVDRISKRIASGRLAEPLFDMLQCPHPQLETVVCEAFVIAFHFPIRAFAIPAPGQVTVRIFTEPCPTFELAQRRAADIREVLRVLTDVHDTLSAFRVVPPEARWLDPA